MIMFVPDSVRWLRANVKWAKPAARQVGGWIANRRAN